MSQQVEVKTEERVVYVVEKPQPRTYPIRPRRLCILILIAVVIILGAYATIAAFGIINNGLNEEIDRFSKENDRLEQIEKDFRAQNEILAEQIDDLNETSSQLNDQVGLFRGQNERYANALTNLNDTIDGLNAKLTELNAIQAQLSDQLSSENESNAQLSESLDSLQVSKQRLENQLTEFNGLRTSISAYTQTTSDSFDSVLQDTLGLFRNVSQLTDESIRVNLFQLAISSEFLQDDSLGLSDVEYDRFLIQAASVLQLTEAELLKQYPFSPTSNSPNMTFAQVADTIQEMSAVYILQ